ncbi:MAG: hypothetical protein JRI23_19320 [Deltaproteobacteria bacterium]|nr:hypothetical protein [Deltaproteobacteria bacterium]MBW2534015.1 hypothetical protein [Deltaproteobacteria bacterium]
MPWTVASALALVACGDGAAESGTGGEAGATATGTGTGAGSATGTATGAATGTATGGTGGAGGVAPASYPAPPYGNQVGDTFPLLAWEGHVNLDADAVATAQPYVDWSSDDARTAGSSHVLVHLAATF